MGKFSSPSKKKIQQFIAVWPMLMLTSAVVTVLQLGKMRMQLPSRAGTCTHLQCFDATTFLMMNEKKATWMCPVCDKPAPFHKLIIDG